MPTYEYHCDQCGESFDRVQKIKDREYACCQCGYSAKKVMSACHFDPRMGVDPDFPTAARKWDKKHLALQSGRMRDSNQTAYGTTLDVEQDAYNLRKKLG